MGTSKNCHCRLAEGSLCGTSMNPIGNKTEGTSIYRVNRALADEIAVFRTVIPI
jgi:hypothetical protein